MYCTVSCCTMWLSFATLPVIVWKRSRAASVSFSLSVCLSASLSLFLSLPLSLSFLYLSLQCLHSLSPAQSSVLLSLLCVFFFYHFIPLESPRHAVTYEFSFSLYCRVILLHMQNWMLFPLMETQKADWAYWLVQRCAKVLSFLGKKKKQTNQSLTTAEAHQITEIKFVTKVFFLKLRLLIGLWNMMITLTKWWTKTNYKILHFYCNCDKW